MRWSLLLAGAPSVVLWRRAAAAVPFTRPDNPSAGAGFIPITFDLGACAG